MFINLSIGFVSFLTSSLLFSVILVIYFIGLKKINQGKLFLLLISATLIWSLMLTLSQIGASIAFEMVVIAELLRYFTWFYVIQQVSGHYREPLFKLDYVLAPVVIIFIFLIAVLTLIFNQQILNFTGYTNTNIIQIIWMMALSVLGLVLIEQLYRNTASENRYQIKLLVICAGSIFGYDFFVYSDALLLQSIDYEFWSARGIVNVLIAPALLMAAARNPSLAPDIHISRQFVFHSTTLIGSGIYLVIMSIAGYIIKHESGEWGSLLQASFLFAAIMLLVTLFFSTTLKTKIKRYLSRSFSNKYDYRQEWNRFSNTLLTHDSENSIFKRALMAVSQIIDSQGATLWIKDHQLFQSHTSWHNEYENAKPVPNHSSLIEYMNNKRALFTVREFYEKHPESVNEYSFLNIENSWLILPLYTDDTLFGFIHLKESVSPMSLDMEDTDLINSIAHHITLSLSLSESVSALQQSERFKQMNQMTTFLVHDLKTLLSQLSLLVDNGKTHKRNPAFVDDMLDTLTHVTTKMNRLILQLKEPEKINTETECDIATIIDSIIEGYQLQPFKLNFTNHLLTTISITGNQEELTSSIKHIIQNAMDSSDRNSEIDIKLQLFDQNSVIVLITDHGKGMSQKFITEDLFKPFESTKGVSGMGIGAYQSREYIRSINGDITVTSKPGIGSTFTITLPIRSTNT